VVGELGEVCVAVGAGVVDVVPPHPTSRKTLIARTRTVINNRFILPSISMVHNVSLGWS
jgi:hypothetical protein